MSNLSFMQVEKDNPRYFGLFKELLISYIEELDTHHPDRDATPRETIINYTQSMMNMQGPYDRHLELCFHENQLVGFFYAKVDYEGHKGYIKIGYCYIMEFYVVPGHRRKGYGKLMFMRILELFREHGAKDIYLTADPVTGKPFWESLGFQYYGEISPENGQAIYEMRNFK